MVLVLYRLKFYVYFFILTAFILYMGYVFNYVYTRYPQWKKIAQDLEAEEENKFINKWEGEMQQRLKRLALACRKNYHMGNVVTDMRYLLWHKKAHLAFCRNAKAGTSSWLHLFLDLSNSSFVSESDAHERATDMFSLHVGETLKLKETLFFTMVRHPFTRLVSAYRDKMAEGYKKEIQQHIIKKYRKTTDDIFMWDILAQEMGIDLDNSPTFREFLMYVVEKIEECSSRPSFQTCLETIDVHWIPFYLRCSPCYIPYNIIAKVETFNEDFRYIKHRLTQMTLERIKEEKSSLSANTSSKHSSSVAWDKDISERATDTEDLLFRLNSWQNRYLEHKSRGTITDHLTKKVWALLTKDEKQKLTDAYLLDFLLFGYNRYKFE